jgi:hypothetical protein
MDLPGPSSMAAAAHMNPASDEAWNLHCATVDDTDIMSRDQLKKSLDAYVKVSQDLTKTLLAARTETIYAKRALQDGREELEAVRDSMAQQLAQAKLETEKANTRAQVFANMSADPTLASALAAQKEPVLFYDAIGRHFRIPFEKCKNRRVGLL